MALVDLLYRCPRCGHDPMEGVGDEAQCARCRTAYRREGPCVVARQEASAPDGAASEVPPPAGRIAPVPDAWRTGVAAVELVDAMDRQGGPLTAATLPDGSLRYRASAVHHGPLVEAPVRRHGRLLGFAERAAPGRAGTLEVTEAALAFRPASTGSGGSPEDWRRPLAQVTALQLASRSLQVGFPGERVFQWTLVDDSPYRWEGLLQELLQRCWRAAGRGEIVEFQPRIVAS